MSEKMIFCLGEGRSVSQGDGYQKNLMVFNKKVTEEEFNKISSSLSDIKISLTHWVKKEDMTDQEKKNNSIWKEIGGYLKVVSYEDAWANFWKTATDKQKQAILDIPQFDAVIFKAITGIDIEKKDNARKQQLINKAEELKAKADELLAEANRL